MLYRDQKLGFEITLPAGWREPGLSHRLLPSYDPSNPEFSGPGGAGLKFAIGPIQGAPSVDSMHEGLQRIAARFGHDVISLGTIGVSGREHATVVYDCLHPSLDQLLVLRFKNYHLVFGGTEYVITARVAVLPRGISLSRPQRLDLERFRMQRERYGQQAEALQQVFAYEEDYDDIIRTLRFLGSLAP